MIKGFTDKYYFLSNFYIQDIHYNGVMYPSSENAYQAAKFPINDRFKFARRSFSLTHPQLSPGQAKNVGRNLPGINPNWDSIKLQVMHQILLVKFLHDPTLRLLLETEDQYLEETNHWHDNYWGACYCKGCEDKIKHNNLGKLLTRIRKQYRLDFGELLGFPPNYKEAGT